MSRPIISVENLSKAYRIGVKEQRYDTLAAAAVGLLKSPINNFRRLKRLNTYTTADDGDDTHWALKDVSFEIAEGEVVGIIGRNGAGKSTLLKLLSRITQPTRGRAVLRGRVASLLEVGTGFHPELTGRENVFLNGTILGMTKKEVERKFDAIVDFSGIEKYLDTPIKRYSSGMTVRLAFAVAAHLEPEILIIDEVLAVGDAEFQSKCLGKMKDVATGGRTVLFVSHNISAVRALCKSGVLLVGGKMVARGPTEDVLNKYMAVKAFASDTARVEAARKSGMKPYIRDARLLNAAGEETQELAQGDDFIVEMTFGPAGTARVSAPTMGVVLKSLMGDLVGGVNTSMQAFTAKSTEGLCKFQCRLKAPPLIQGKYTMDIYLGDGQFAADVLEDVIAFSVMPNDIYGTGIDPRTDLGSVFLHADWATQPIDSTVSV